MSGVDALIGHGYIDERNLFITGGSAGGVLSSWIIGKTNRFRAAAVVNPAINWASHDVAARPSNLIAKVAHIIAWFDKHRTAVDGD